MKIASAFLKELPLVDHAVLYGSSYLKKPLIGVDSSAQVDLILAVKDPLDWHKQNLKTNPKHYSSVCQSEGPEFIVDSVSKAAGIHYNPFVYFEGKRFKYGVISVQDLCEDLRNWKTLYMAGRFQKPKLALVEDKRVTIAQQKNLRMALAVGMLTLPEVTTEEDLFFRISSISYVGDNRIEDPSKVRNIVKGNIDKFLDMYLPMIKDFGGFDIDNGAVEVICK